MTLSKQTTDHIGNLIENSLGGIIMNGLESVVYFYNHGPNAISTIPEGKRIVVSFRFEPDYNADRLRPITRTKLMIYMTPQSSPTNELPSDRWGFISSPERWGSTIPDGRLWCMDNGVFTGKFTPAAFWNKLDVMMPFQKRCIFIVAPDFVADAYATMCLFSEWGRAIKDRGWPVALVAQDDMELFPFPKVGFDALFIGGSTEWKMSDAALHCIKRAQKLGKWTHVGRVNSQKRLAHFQIAGVDSVDGTTVCFAPDKNYPVIERQLQRRALPFWRIQ